LEKCKRGRVYKPENGREEKAVTLNQLIRTEKGSEPVNETASTKEEAEGSSSVEPEWGRFAKQNEKEIEEDYHTWKSVNVEGYTGQRKVHNTNKLVRTM
jgi:hypothetical protein